MDRVPAGKMVVHVLFGGLATLSFWVGAVLALLAIFNVLTWTPFFIALVVFVVAVAVTLVNFVLLIRAGEKFVGLRPSKK